MSLIQAIISALQSAIKTGTSKSCEEW